MGTNAKSAIVPTEAPTNVTTAPAAAESGAVTEGPAVPGTSAPSPRPQHGDQTQILIPGEDRALQAHYEVRELADVQQQLAEFRKQFE